MALVPGGQGNRQPQPPEAAARSRGPALRSVRAASRTTVGPEWAAIVILRRSVVRSAPRAMLRDAAEGSAHRAAKPPAPARCVPSVPGEPNPPAAPAARERRSALPLRVLLPQGGRPRCESRREWMPDEASRRRGTQALRARRDPRRAAPAGKGGSPSGLPLAPSRHRSRREAARGCARPTLAWMCPGGLRSDPHRCARAP